MEDDFGLWDVIVSVFWFMLLVAWFWMIMNILGDLFRDRELSGGAKALWALFIVIVPWLGVLIYILVRGDSMNAREQQRAKDHEANLRSYLSSTAEPTISQQLRELTELRDLGVLTPAEYEQAKAKALT